MTRETDKVDQNRDKGGKERSAPQRPARQEKRDAPDVPARPPQKRDLKDRKY